MTPRSERVRIIGLLVLWALVVLTGMVVLVRYSLAPGRSAHAPASWPVASVIPRQEGRSTLILIAHPHCACTRASLGELAVLLAHSSNRIAATVLLVKPNGTATTWADTDLRRTAEAIPGVRVLVDEGGHEAVRFGTATSGQVLLYDPAGRLEFSGGITAGRGHAGDNAGREAVLAMVMDRHADRSTTAVFGCELFEKHEPGAVVSALACRGR